MSRATHGVSVYGMTRGPCRDHRSGSGRFSLASADPNAEMYAICRRDRKSSMRSDDARVKERYTSYDDLLKAPNASRAITRD